MKIFLFYFEMAIKITGSAQNYRVGRVSGNTPIFFLGLMLFFLLDFETLLWFCICTDRFETKLVGNTEDRFSRDEAHELRCEKTGLWGFRPGPTQTRLYSDRRWLEA